MKLTKTIALGAALCAALCASAQNTEAGFFLDDYTYRYQMNPAYGNSHGFVAMPALGNLNIGVSSNVGVDNFLYNVNGKTTTFLNPNVSVAEALDGIKDVNRIGYDIKLNIISVGFKAFGGYNTVGLNVRSSMGIKLPGSLFSMLKEGVTNKTYEIANLKGYANGWGELQFGHSRNITPEIRVGANFKFLIGGANANIDMRRADLVLGTDAWHIETDADINLNLKGAKYKTDINDRTKHRYVNGLDVDGAGVGGFGIAFDLGGVYKPKFLPDWEFSAAILDLGFISWSNNMLASTNGLKTFSTDKYTFNVDDNATNSFDNEIDKIKDDVSALYELDDMGDQGSQTRPLGATMNIGALYTFPYYRKLKFGLLNTTRIQGKFSWTDFRLSANVMPCKIFDAAINMSAGTFGVGFGWLLNLHCPGFNFFLGMDRTPFKLAKPGVPMGLNAQFNMGINFLIK